MEEQEQLHLICEKCLHKVYLFFAGGEYDARSPYVFGTCECGNEVVAIVIKMQSATVLERKE